MCLQIGEGGKIILKELNKMNPLAQGMALGYTGQQLLNFLTKAIPSLSPKISQAQKAGHSIEKIINFLGKTMEAQSYPKNMTQNQIHGQKTKEKEALTKGLLAKGAALLGTGLATAAVSRALPTLASGLMQQGSTPPVPNQPTNPGGTPPTLPTPQQPQPSVPTQQPQGPTSPIPSPNQPVTPQATLATSPSQQPPVNNNNINIPNLQQSTQPEVNPLQSKQVPPLPQALQKQVESMLAAGNDVENIAGTIKATQPQVAKEYEKTTNVAIADAVKQFAETNPIQTRKPEPMEGEQPPINRENALLESEIKPSKPLEKKSVVALPNGDIGEVTDIRQGIATVNANGKTYRRKVEDLIQEPEDIEEATRQLMKFIPEGDKSTSIQNSIFFNLPGEKEDVPILLTKFWDGKIAWYKGIDENSYRQIALGTYEPKTSGKTSIGEYKPGVIDSRGAAFHQLVKMNPLFNKENKGKTWGYADNEYDALKSMQSTLKTMSREKVNETGNIVEKRPRKPLEKSPKLTESLSGTKVSALPNEKIKETKIEKKDFNNSNNLRLKEIHEKIKGTKKHSIEKFKLQNEFEKELKKIDEPIKKFEKPDITTKGLKNQKDFILNKLEDALKNPDENKEYINIDVPNDGHFRIINTKGALQKFYERVEKKWPTKALPSTEPKTHKR